VDSGRAPVSIRLDISLNSDFGLLVFADSAVGDTSTFFVRRLLPQNSTLYFRASVTDRFGCNIGSTVGYPPRHTGTYLTLVAPNSAQGQSLHDVTPTFVWSSARLEVPPGPWTYNLSIINVGTGTVQAYYPGLADTTFTIPAAQPLEAQTSYRWSVTELPVSGNPVDSVRVASEATFTIVPVTIPATTLLYQNFPNPFPASYSSNTCIWFDLSAPSTVHLTVHTLRGDLVRTLIPGLRDARMDAGRYGRGNLETGCDPVQPIVWDGTADDGRVVPRGVYLLIFEANGVHSVKKILFRGR
jgi:hypothetical protein